LIFSAIAEVLPFLAFLPLAPPSAASSTSALISTAAVVVVPAFAAASFSAFSLALSFFI